jgi:predicted anti-sigma-YlaC factor YlaD
VVALVVCQEGSSMTKRAPPTGLSSTQITPWWRVVGGRWAGDVYPDPAGALGLGVGERREVHGCRRHVSVQFLSEALLPSAAGGLAGVVLGAAVTAAYDAARGWQVVVPVVGLAGAVAAALAIGVVAGLYPATRAARLAPTDALRTV